MYHHLLLLPCVTLDRLLQPRSTSPAAQPCTQPNHTASAQHPAAIKTPCAPSSRLVLGGRRDDRRRSRERNEKEAERMSMYMAASASGARAAEVKTEGLLRGACALLAAAAALLVGLNTQTETVLLIRKKATVKDVQALWVLAMAAAATAGYHLLQLLRCFYLSRFVDGDGKPCCRGRRTLAWICFLLDKGCAYMTFATTVAAAQACVVALEGTHALQWNKLCNIYTRFCEQVAGSLVCGMLAAVAAALLSAVSARNLFRLYPSAPPPSFAG